MTRHEPRSLRQASHTPRKRSARIPTTAQTTAIVAVTETIVCLLYVLAQWVSGALPGWLIVGSGVLLVSVLHLSLRVMIDDLTFLRQERQTDEVDGSVKPETTVFSQ